MINVTYSLYVPEDKLTEGDELTIYNEYELVYGRINIDYYFLQAPKVTDVKEPDREREDLSEDVSLDLISPCFH